MGYEILGAEGKAEAVFIEPFLKSLFHNVNPEKYIALALVGINPYKSNKRELDLILFISWNEHSDNKIVLSSNQAVRKYCHDTKKEIILSNRETIYLNSCVVTIEIKSHDARGVKIEGEDIYFRYDRWECASAKLNEQAKSASDFIRDQFGLKEMVAKFIYMPNVKSQDLNVSSSLNSVLLYNGCTLRELLDNYLLQNGIDGNAISQENRNTYHRLGRKNKNLLANESALLNTIKAYYKQLFPSYLEQEKMELLSKRYIESDKEWCNLIGKNLIAFTGRAGTGKTVKLLRTAKDLADDNMDNVLLLTFNRALARDLQRLMQLQKISSGTAITILTIDQFLFRVAFRAGILSDDDVKDFLNISEGTGQRKNVFNAVRELLCEAIKDSKTIEIIQKYYREYTMVAIDEAQDWFQEERDIILNVFPPNKVLIAAGTDQCLRAPTLANWKGDVISKGFEFHVVRSNIALRQTTNLSDFCNLLSRNIGLDWSVDKNANLLGGEIYLFTEFNKNVIDIFTGELKDKTQTSYHPIDFLTMLSNQGGQGNKIKSVYEIFSSNNIKYWDAVSPEGRDELPELEKIRCVSLESCRGLEGWATIVFDLDQWTSFALSKEASRNPNLGFSNLASLPTWFLIPFTRAKHRMLIELPKIRTDLREILLNLQKSNKDFIRLLN